jgi:hypothetical protein
MMLPGVNARLTPATWADNYLAQHHGLPGGIVTLDNWSALLATAGSRAI